MKRNKKMKRTIVNIIFSILATVIMFFFNSCLEKSFGGEEELEITMIAMTVFAMESIIYGITWFAFLHDGKYLEKKDIIVIFLVYAAITAIASVIVLKCTELILTMLLTTIVMVLPILLIIRINNKKQKKAIENSPETQLTKKTTDNCLNTETIPKTKI